MQAPGTSHDGSRGVNDTPLASPSQSRSPEGAATSKAGKAGVKSQRPSWSCTECSRRKIKCDKVVPCQQCCRRGKAASCHLAEETKDLSSSITMATREPLNNPEGSGPLRLASSTEYGAIRQAVVGIRQRLYHLEKLFANFVPQGDMGADGGPQYAFVPQEPPEGPVASFGEEAESPAGDGLPVASGSGSAPALSRVREQDSNGAESDGEVNAAITLEFLALGRDRKQDHFSRATLRRPEEDDGPLTSPAGGTAWNASSSSLFPSPDPSLRTAYGIGPVVPDVFPSQGLSAAIVDYSLDRMAWQHGAVHPPTFRAEVAEFFGFGEQRLAVVNQAWLALYAAVLCVGVKHMSAKDRVDLGIASEDPARLPKQYFDASVEALYRANFLAKHQIFSVQAITVLVLACQDVGESDLIATLLSCALRIGQHLKIHRFSSDAEWDNRRRRNGVEPHSPEGIHGLIEREVRKRLWCALTTEDWINVPWRGSYSVVPSHFTTPPPVNVLDSDLAQGNLIPRSLEEPTIATKLILSIRVASCVRRFFDDVHSSGGPSYPLCLEIDREIREIQRTAPSYLKAETNIKHLPPTLSSMRNYWLMSTAHKLLIIHRTFLGRSFRDPRYTYSRKAAIDAARTILQRFSMTALLPHHVWTSIYQTVSASTILCLDIFQSSPASPADDVAAKRQEVQAALEQLTLLQHSSPIAARGVQLLATLLAEEAKHRRSLAGTETAGRKRKVVPDPVDAGRFGDAAKRIGVVPDAMGAPTAPYAPTQFSPTLYPYQPLDTSPGAASEESLTQDAYQSILQSGFGNELYTAAGFGSPGENGMLETNADFWRVLDNHFDSGPTTDFSGGSTDPYAMQPWT